MRKKQLIFMCLCAAALCGCGKKTEPSDNLVDISGFQQEDSKQAVTEEQVPVTEQNTEVTDTAADKNVSVTMPEYQSYTLDQKEDLSVTDADVTEMESIYLSSFADGDHVTDREITAEDRIHLTYSIEKDGAAVEHFSNISMTPAVNADYIFGANADIVGKKPGDEITGPAAFAFEYGQKETYDVRIRLDYIIENEKTPEATEEWVKENTGCQSMDEFQDFLKQMCSFDKIQKAYEDQDGDILADFISGSEVSAPDIYYEKQPDKRKEVQKTELLLSKFCKKEGLDTSDTAYSDFWKYKELSVGLPACVQITNYNTAMGTTSQIEFLKFATLGKLLQIAGGN